VRTNSSRVSHYTRKLEQRMCQNRSMAGISQSVRNRKVSEVTAWLRTACDNDSLDDLSTAAEMSTLTDREGDRSPRIDGIAAEMAKAKFEYPRGCSSLERLSFSLWKSPRTKVSSRSLIDT
jgi:hypothetical protein